MREKENYFNALKDCTIMVKERWVLGVTDTGIRLRWARGG